MHKAFQVAILSTTSYKVLFGVISNKCSEDREDMPNTAICTHHHHAIVAGIHKRLNELLHTVVEQLVANN